MYFLICVLSEKNPNKNLNNDLGVSTQSSIFYLQSWVHLFVHITLHLPMENAEPYYISDK